MKFYISYFAQMRHFTRNILPVSTAAWDAKWFEGIDRIDDLLIPLETVAKLEQHQQMCYKGCQRALPCPFMQEYAKYLDTLDFAAIIKQLESFANEYTDTIVLLVYEMPSVKCAERPVLQEWFRKNGVELEEWQKPVKNKKVSLI